MIKFPDIEFRTVVVDPPWTPSLNKGQKNFTYKKSSPQKFYKTLSLEEIISIKPPTAKQAHIYIWCISQHVDWAYIVARAWKCEPIILLTWCKPGVGTGAFLSNSEHILVTRKGSRKGNPFGGKNKPATKGTYFHWTRGKHSEKPQEFFDLVETISPEPRLEMYARKTRPGWHSWGDEL